MAFDERLAERIRGSLGKRKGLVEKKMFGGVAFLLNGNMCVGVHKSDLLVPLGSRPAAYAQSVRRHAPLEVRYSVRIDDYVSSFHSRFLFLDPSILPCRLLPTSTSWVIPSKVPMSTWRPALWLQTITTSAETKRLGFTFGGKRSARAWRSSVQSSGITVASAPMRCCRPVRFLNRTRL